MRHLVPVRVIDPLETGAGGSCEVLVYLKIGLSNAHAGRVGTCFRICMPILPVIAGTDAACSNLSFRRGGNAT